MLSSESGEWTAQSGSTAAAAIQVGQFPEAGSYLPLYYPHFIPVGEGQDGAPHANGHPTPFVPYYFPPYYPPYPVIPVPTAQPQPAPGSKMDEVADAINGTDSADATNDSTDDSNSNLGDEGEQEASTPVTPDAPKPRTILAAKFSSPPSPTREVSSHDTDAAAS
jgi:hypothetical protein